MRPHLTRGDAVPRRLCVLTVLFATATSSLMQTFLTVSLPTITAELGSVTWYGWVVGSYLAASTVFIWPAAALGDRFGPRAVHISGMLIWAVGTLVVSSAGSVPALLLARVIQGIGAAAVVPAGFAAIATVYPGSYGRFVGIIGAVQACVVLAGGPLGGWLGTAFGWRCSLQIVTLAALAPILLGLFALPNQRAPAIVTGKGAILRAPAVRCAIAQTMLLSAVAFGVSAYLPLLLETRFQLDLAATAVLITPALVGVAVGSAIGGVMAERHDTTRIAWLIVLAGLFIAWIPLTTAVVVGSALAAAGVGVGLPAQLIAIGGIATAAHVSTAGGIVQGARNIGGALGVALLGLPLQFNAAPESGAGSAFSIMRCIACLAILVTVLSASPGCRVGRSEHISNTSAGRSDRHSATRAGRH